MASTTVRISKEAKETLQRLSSDTGRSLQDLMSEAVERYRRQLFLEEANEAFAALSADETAWAEEAQERADWDETLADGLEP